MHRGTKRVWRPPPILLLAPRLLALQARAEEPARVEPRAVRSGEPPGQCLLRERQLLPLESVIRPSQHESIHKPTNYHSSIDHAHKLGSPPGPVRQSPQSNIYVTLCNIYLSYGPI